MFDVDADPDTINRHLQIDPLLRGRIRRRPGLRVPGAWEPFELAVRAIVGQQASVAGAATLVKRLTRTFGSAFASGDDSLAWTFPDAAALADAPLERVGLTRARAAAIRALAASFAAGELAFDEDCHPDTVVARLRELPGVGPWTAQYIAMRGLSDPDAFPIGDLGLRRATDLTDRALAERAEAWRPWRAYAAMHLWMEPDHADNHSIHRHAKSRRTTVARARRERASRAAVHQRTAAG
jgi:3-methyladenine DNA glycosylase/8-oxoguanine DNA glycosylase